MGKCILLFLSFSVTNSCSCFVNLRLIALVIFGLRSSGMYFFFL